MAPTYLPPVARFQAVRSKSQPKLAVFSPKASYTPPRVLTMRRLRGVETPTVRQSAATELPTAALVREAIATALNSIETLERESHDVALRFQRRALGEAHLGLTRLFQLTQSVLRLADMTAAAAGTTLAAFCEAEHLSAPIDTDAVVSRLVREQLAENWSAVAAVLDRPFASALGGWRQVFEAFTPTTGPHGTAA